MKPALLIIVFMIAVPFTMLSAHGNDNGETTGAAAEVIDPPVDADSGLNELVIHAYNWGFDFNDYKIRAGEPVKIILIIDEGHHGIRIDGFDLKTGNYRTGETAEFIVQAPEAGEYEIRCNVYCGSGHRSMSDVIRVVD